MEEKFRKERLKQFSDFHEKLLGQWEEVMKTGDTTCFEKEMIEDYKVYFFKKGNDQPDIYELNEIKEGMRQSVSALKGGNKTFVNKVIRMRNDQEAAVFYEQIIEMDGRELARLFTIERWEFIEDKWVMTREIVEQVS